MKYQIHHRSDTQTRDQETKHERIYKLCQETVEECIYQSMARLWLVLGDERAVMLSHTL